MINLILTTLHGYWAKHQAFKLQEPVIDITGASLTCPDNNNVCMRGCLKKLPCCAVALHVQAGAGVGSSLEGETKEKGIN